MATDLRTFVTDSFESAIADFLKDIDALSHDDLSKSFGKGSRCAYDFIYEVGVINQRVAFRCRAEDPGPMPWKFGEEWLGAPAEFRDKEAAKRHIKKTSEEVLASIGDEVERPVVVGETDDPAYQRINFATMHTMYHDAQLNYIQSMVGDLAVHW